MRARKRSLGQDAPRAPLIESEEETQSLHCVRVSGDLVFSVEGVSLTKLILEQPLHTHTHTRKPHNTWGAKMPGAYALWKKKKREKERESYFGSSRERFKPVGGGPL